MPAARIDLDGYLDLSSLAILRVDGSDKGASSGPLESSEPDCVALGALYASLSISLACRGSRVEVPEASSGLIARFVPCSVAVIPTDSFLVPPGGRERERPGHFSACSLRL
jgi:hypothetical protein